MITIYTLPNCYYCRIAKVAMDEEGIKYEEFRIGEHIDRDKILELFPGIKTAPIIVIPGTSQYYGDSNFLFEWIENGRGGYGEGQL